MIKLSSLVSYDNDENNDGIATSAASAAANNNNNNNNNNKSSKKRNLWYRMQVTCVVGWMVTSGVVKPTYAFSTTFPSLQSLRNQQRSRTCHHPLKHGSIITWLKESSNNNNDMEKTREELEFELDVYLSNNNLRAAANQMKRYSQLFVNNDDGSNAMMNKDRFVNIFRAIEERTGEAEENDFLRNNNNNNDNNNNDNNSNNNYNNNYNDNNNNMDDASFPAMSVARMEMTEMYKTLQSLGHLCVFGAASDTSVLPAQGTKFVTPDTLERVTDLSMVSLTPKPNNSFFLAGTALAISEAIVSALSTGGIDFNILVGLTIFLATLDKLLLNGALFESLSRIIQPEYGRKILRHEAGHFLCAYLLGCPVEGCVLNAWDALRDSRFQGTVSAGTSFFDPQLSQQINNASSSSLTRESIDRYSIIVMGGIAAEAINFGRADGGAGDEMALVRFLTALNPRAGGAVTWDSEMIRNQARWAAMQAVLLLQQYSVCYEALVQALEQKSTTKTSATINNTNLGDCIYAIEQAARIHNLPIPQQPLGTILLNGQWILNDNNDENMNDTTIQNNNNNSSSTINGNNTTNNNNNGVPTQDSIGDSDDILSSSDEFLATYRQIMNKKLQDIDARLDELDNNP